MSTATINSDITFDTREQMIGKRIRVLYAGSYPNLTGTTHTVTSVFNRFEPGTDREWQKVDGITVGITAEGLNDLWVQSYEVVDDAPFDGEFTVGDCVRYTGILTPNGIESESGQGVVVEAADNVYVIQTGRNTSVISGPGYMFPTVIEEHGHRLGQAFKVLNNGTAAEATLGQVGILTGSYSERRPLLTFPRNIQQHLTNFPGSWSYTWDLIELVGATVEDTVAPKVWNVGDFAYTDNGSIHKVIAGVIVSMNDLTVYLRSTPEFAFHVSRDTLKECPVIGVGSKVIAYCVSPTRHRQDSGVLVEITQMDYAGNFTGTLVNGGNEVTFSEWGPALDETGALLTEERTKAPFVDGDPVVIVNRTDMWQGREGTYRRPEEGSSRHRIEFPGHGPAYFNLGDIARRTVEPVVEAASEPVVDREVENLRRRLAAAEANVAAGKEAIGIIGGRLINEANNRGWCSDYDRIIEDVNSEVASGWELPARNAEYEVTWTESFTVTVHRSATITARDEDDAIEIAQEYDTADRSMLREAISNGNYSHDESDDYEAS